MSQQKEKLEELSIDELTYLAHLHPNWGFAWLWLLAQAIEEKL